MPEPIYLKTDHDVTITGFRVRSSGAYLNAATATYVVKNHQGNQITGGTGSLSYVASSNGNYLGVIESTVLVTDSLVPLTEFQTCTVEITIAESGYNDFRVLEFEVRKRGKH